MALHEHPHRHTGIHLPSWLTPASATAADEAAGARTTVLSTTTAQVLAGIRLLLGFVFLWAFFDKAFGWGYATSAGKSWTAGGSPTRGFLSSVAAGPMETTFHNWAGAGWADWLFMLGLLGTGLALTTGVALRFAAAAGTAMMVLMWTAEWPLAQHLSNGRPSMSSNPIVDYHLLYAAVLIALAVASAGHTWGLGKLWARLPIVRSNSWLR